MNYYHAKCNELNLLLFIQHILWAQQKNRMSGWRPKDRLILYTEEGVAGLFEVKVRKSRPNAVETKEQEESLKEREKSVRL